MPPARRACIAAVAGVVIAGTIVTAPPAAAKACDGVTAPCVIGDTGPGGGIVFFDAGSTQPWGRYLEAAPAGWIDNPNSPSSPTATPVATPTLAVPGAPSGLAAVGVQGGLQVSWKAPQTGGSGLVYVVRTDPGGRGCRTAKLSCAVKGLKAGQQYEVSVVAMNSAGEGKPARQGPVRVPARPTPTPRPEPTEKPLPEYRSWRERTPRVLPMAAEDPRVVWCPRDAAGYDTLLPTGTAIGTGRANTQVIIAACGASTAAGVAAGYRGGGKADWFLPSKDELHVLYQQRAVVGGFAGDYFWSSSQSSNPVGTAWYQGFGRGNQSIPYKVGEYRVRPVRAFG